jgi:hypothetical protein
MRHPRFDELPYDLLVPWCLGGERLLPGDFRCDVHNLPHHVHAVLYCVLEECWMSTARNRIAHKHFRLDVAKIKRAQRFLKTGTETEAVDRALDLVIAEHERDRLTREANERFVKSGIEIRDVYGKLAE